MVYSQIQLYLPMGGLPHWLATSQNSFKRTLCSSKTKAQKRKKKNLSQHMPVGIWVALSLTIVSSLVRH
jgi:hypothetical protein